MLKFETIEAQIQRNVDEFKRITMRNQYPKSKAPVLDADLEVEICGCVFNLHKQEGTMLVLKANEKANFERNVKIISAISYIAGARNSVAVAGWDWRPLRYKGNKLFLRPIAPTLL